MTDHFYALRLCFVLFMVMPVCASLGQRSPDDGEAQAFGTPINTPNASLSNVTDDWSLEEPSLLYAAWVPMTIFGKDYTEVTVDSANYLIGDDNILFVKQGQFYELVPEYIAYVQLGFHMFFNSQYKDKENVLRTSYFEILEIGDYSLLGKHEIVKEVKADLSMGIPTEPEIRYRHGKRLFYKAGPSARPVELPTKKHDVIKIFKHNRADMIKYAHENNLSLSDQEDVQSLFAYYNSLREGS